MIAIRPEPLPCRSDIYLVRPLVVRPHCLSSTESALAFHEAGHVAAALALGLSPLEATIGGGKGTVSLYDATPATGSGVEPEKTSEPEFQAALLLLITAVALPADSDTSRALAITTVLMAGVQSELLFSGHDSAGLLLLQDGDSRKAIAVLRQVFGTKAPLAWCQANARAILTQRWSEVEAIAHDLMTNGFWKPEANDAVANV